MKRLIIKIIYFAIFFAIFFIVINVLYIGIIIRTDFDFKKRLETLNFENPEFDLLVLGSSTAFDGVDTELLTSHGIKSYNLAMGGTPIMTNYIQLNEYLTKYSKRPKCVLLCVSSPLERTFDDELINPIIEVTRKDHRFRVDDVPILKFRWLGFVFLKKIFSKAHRDAQLSYGQAKFQKSTPDHTPYKENYLDLKKFESSYWIGELVKLCFEKGMELIIIEMPGYREIQNLSEFGPHILSFHNGHYAPLYNYNYRDFCEIFDAEKDWAGNSHLNEFGGIKFTREILHLVETLCTGKQ